MERLNCLLIIITGLYCINLCHGQLKYFKDPKPYQRQPGDVGFITDCVYYNGKDLTCYYDTAEGRGPLYMAWTFEGLTEAFICGNTSVDNTSCSWYETSGRDSPKANHNYLLLLVNASISPTPVTRVVSMIPLNFVKPERVKNLEITKTNTSVTITWSPPDVIQKSADLSLIYNVNLTQSEVLKESLNTSNTTATFEDLTPYTDYEISVKSYPVYRTVLSGHWSEAAFQDARTLQGLPVANPEFAGYFLRNVTDTTRLTVIWKPISETDARGPSWFYKLFEGGHLLQNLTKFYGDIQLNPQHSHKIEIRSSQSFGWNTSLPATALNISYPLTGEMIPSVSPVRYSNSSIAFHWSPVDSIKNYNLYWCHKNPIEDTCQDSIDMKPVSVEDIGIAKSFNLESEREYKFAVAAAATYGKNFPMTWNTCIYQADKAIAEPKDLRGSSNTNAGELVVFWNTPFCGTSGYIEKYVIHYCKSSDCKNTHKTAEVPFSSYSWIDNSAAEGVQYTVWVDAVSPISHTVTSQNITVHTYTNSLGGGVITGIVLAVLIILALMVFVVIHLVRSYKKTLKKMKELPITLPEIEKLNTADSEDYFTSDNLDSRLQNGGHLESQWSDNRNNAQREGFESRSSENRCNELREGATDEVTPQHYVG